MPTTNASAGGPTETSHPAGALRVPHLPRDHLLRTPACPLPTGAPSLGHGPSGSKGASAGPCLGLMTDRSPSRPGSPSLDVSPTPHRDAQGPGPKGSSARTRGGTVHLPEAVVAARHDQGAVPVKVNLGMNVGRERKRQVHTGRMAPRPLLPGPAPACPAGRLGAGFRPYRLPGGSGTDTRERGSMVPFTRCLERRFASG